MSEPDVDVLVVGGGPVGLSMSICLSRLGVTSRVVERHPTTTNHPKATVVNTRTMELFRQWGVEPAVSQGAVPADRMRCIVWATTLAGPEIGRLEVGSDAARFLEAGRWSPSVQRICPQDVVEPALADVARQHELSTVSFSTALEEFEVTGSTVAAVLGHADGTTEHLTARYLVGADGAGSPVRTALGVDLVGDRDLGRLLNLNLRVDLGPWIDDRPGPLYWIVNPEVPGVFIALDGVERWLFNTPWGDDEAPDATTCVRMVRRAVGSDDVEVRIESALPWTAHSLVARSFRAGPCFLVGDAAHQFPPTGGHGMNSGIQDAHNLAWKLAAVLRGEAGDALLDTFETERRPVAERYAAESVRNAAGQRVSGRSIPPAIEDDTEEGEEIRSLVASTIPAQRGHFVSPGLQLGLGYESTAVVPEENSSTEEAADVDDVTEFRPVVAAGHRAPHAWIPTTQAAPRRSLIDEFDGRFTLVVRDGSSLRTAEATELGVHVLTVGAAEVAAVDDLAHLDAVLVRPDGIVAKVWRTAADRSELGEVLRRVLSLGPSGPGAVATPLDHDRSAHS